MKNSENVPYLEITGMVLVHCNNVTKVMNKIHEFDIYLFLINRLVN